MPDLNDADEKRVCDLFNGSDERKRYGVGRIAQIVGCRCSQVLRALKKNNLHRGIDEARMFLRKEHLPTHPIYKTTKGPLSHIK
jgi:hypothetical protein